MAAIEYNVNNSIEETELIMKKIVAIGPESTGKSTLCEKLAAHYNSLHAKEYAREYLLNNGTDYTFENLLDIAKGQIRLEEEAITRVENRMIQSAGFNPGYLFLDTDMYVMKVWCEFVFDRCHPWILDRIAERKYDLYLLCNTDAPWVKDELREYPDTATRNRQYHYYKDILSNQQVPWVDISGDYEERLEKAITAVDTL